MSEENIVNTVCDEVNCIVIESPNAPVTDDFLQRIINAIRAKLIDYAMNPTIIEEFVSWLKGMSISELTRHLFWKTVQKALENTVWVLIVFLLGRMTNHPVFGPPGQIELENAPGDDLEAVVVENNPEPAQAAAAHQQLLDFNAPPPIPPMLMPPPPPLLQIAPPLGVQMVDASTQTVEVADAEMQTDGASSSKSTDADDGSKGTKRKHSHNDSKDSSEDEGGVFNGKGPNAKRPRE